MLRSPARAAILLRAQVGGSARPDLIIVTESAAYSAADMKTLRGLLSNSVVCVHAVVAGSATRRDVDALRGFDQRRHPLSPAELEEMTA